MPARGPTLRLTIRCRLRELRGERKLVEVAELSGVSPGSLSQLERGERLPRAAHLEGLERAYGPQEDWYRVDILSEEAAA